MRAIIGGLLLTLAFAVLQEESALRLGILDTKPDLLLLLVLSVALQRGPRAGLLLGVLAGYLEGSSIGKGVGSYMLSKGLVGLVAGGVGAQIVRDSPLVLALAGFATTWFAEILFACLFPRVGLTFWLIQVSKEAAYNMLLVIPCYYITALALGMTGGASEGREGHSPRYLEVGKAG